MQTQSPEKYQFEEFQLDVLRRRLLRDETPLTLNPKAFDMLLVLVKNCGKLLSKEDLFEMVWEDQIVEESNLTVNMSQIRKALGEKANQPRFINTVSGQGYRFLANVREIFAESVFVVPEKIPTKIVSNFQTLAVLPFKTLGKTEENNYLGLGMADALITKLSNLKDLRVRPTSAVIKYNGIEQNPIEAGNSLRVESVIEGSIWHFNERLRVTVQLVNVKEEATVWAEKFDESFTDIFTIQDSISERVATSLEVKLSRNEQAQINKRETENLTAYQLFTQALFHMHRYTPQDTKQAIPYLEKAIEVDPNYALAYAFLIGCYLQLATFNVAPTAEFAEKSRSLVKKVSEIDDTLPATHYAKAFVYMYFDWDFRRAEKSFRYAIELNPNDALANKHYSYYLFVVGRFEEAIAQAHSAFELDPQTPDVIANVANNYYYARRYQEAIEWHRKALEIEPQFGMSLLALATIYANKGMTAEACSMIDRLIPFAQSEPSFIAVQGYIYAILDKTVESEKCLQKLKELSAERYVSAYEIAAVYSGLKALDEAFNQLEIAVQERSIGLLYLIADPRFDNLHNDSRYDDLLKRIGFKTT
ncbi:MAG TPA: winged helix-turn-helix domain-containing protein [Pyrinomonadaceae bacterium]|nr:winged helix-turn-helix domain-containing protein [Pyrinomonadaceae bacterium]